MRHAARVIRPAILLAVVSAAALPGCTIGEHTQAHKDHQEIRGAPTPELMTLYQRTADVENDWTIMENENKRMFWQDMGRAFYTDRPSRLTREPIPY